MSLSQHYVGEICPCVIGGSSLFSVLQFIYIVRTHHNLFVRSLVDEHFECFEFGDITDSRTCPLVHNIYEFLSGVYLRVG